MGSPTSPAALGTLALEAAVEAAWRGWTALGASGGRPTEAEAIIDPEVLLLATCALADHERRLADFLLWWAETGATLLSAQRVRSLAKQMPWSPEAQATLAAFAASAVDAGDRRWRRMAGPDLLDARTGKGAPRPSLRHPSALVLRLRAAFGVSAKADLLAVLLGSDLPQAVRALAERVAYSTVAVRVALGELVLAGFAREEGGHPAAYAIADREAWSALLGTAPVRWGHQAEAFALLLDVAAWGRQADAAGWSAYVASSKARDLAVRHEAALRRLAPRFAGLDGARGEAALPAFGAAVHAAVAALIPEKGEESQKGPFTS